MFRPRRLLALLLLAAASLPAPANDSVLQQKQSALDALRERIGELQKRMQSDQGQREALAEELEKAERRLADSQQALRKLNSRIAAQAQKLRETQQQQRQTQAQLDQRHAELGQQLRAAYVLGRQGQTQLLLNIDDVQRVGRNLSYYDYLQRAQLRLIADIQARAAELEQLAALEQQEQDELEALRRQQQSQLGELQSQRQDRAQVLDKVKARIADEQGDLAQLKADERAIRKLIESLKAAQRALPPEVAFSDSAFTRQKGKLPWPLRGPLLARYGQAKADGRLSWNGHWIGGAAGSPVKAVAPGRVAYVGWMHRYGLIVLVEHESGYFSLYGHCQSAAVAAGATISAGQVLAYAGDSGGYDQPGLYFEIRRGTEAVDPAQWLAR
ncbi:Septal ring factor EnvC, activator of murein hydrolases AmiA and AmiB [Solimonas aquatica]|uniref:Septal ring factor EnvC, activator of murein hydrolases AmiA and AmiB n=1 Tax=Solimonas aquatica TaxID=489703 RepID=A0A1H9EH20_9GAMM|nr:peptidoglycan DD-metalloendopeptidase family protein [Solimonas aquatica]SEQ24872.1 Septal ring factor EnvC, activator of murein hydrolases AmiA and AmiB [Solimonas aquatica]